MLAEGNNQVVGVNSTVTSPKSDQGQHVQLNTMKTVNREKAVKVF
jgi:hypothetical protein